jgi:hypothetical protein
MKYTIQNGVERRFSERVNYNSHFIIPLLVILAGVAFYLLNPYHSSRPPSKPLTLGIYTVKTPDNTVANNSGNPNSSSSSGTPDLNGATQSGALNPQAEIASPVYAAPSEASSVISLGGRGGDVPAADVAPPPAPAPASITPSVTSCVDKLTSTTMVCYFPYQACVVPLGDLTGVKTVDGSCIIIN